MSDQTYEALNHGRAPRFNRRPVLYVVAGLVLVIASALYFRLRNQE